MNTKTFIPIFTHYFMAIIDSSIISDFKTGLIVIISIVALHLILFIISLISVIRSQKSGLTKFNWILFQFLFVIIGPLVYFIFGREKDFSSYSQTFQSRPSAKLESVFKSPNEDLAKSVTTSQTESTQQTSQLRTGSLFEQEKQIEVNARLQQAVDYVKTSISKGFEIEKIKDALRKSGWREEDIATAIIEAQKK